MTKCLTLDGNYGNPASRSHSFGWDAEKAVEDARGHVAALIHADPKEIVWTSGATESNNLAIKGAAHFYQKKGKHIITCKTEHKAVLDTCRQLEREGFEVTYLEPQSSGMIDLDKFQAAIRDDTVLVSIMHRQQRDRRHPGYQGQLVKSPAKRKIIFHVDAAQSPGKAEVDLRDMNVDLMSLSAHKVYGPKVSAPCMYAESRVCALKHRYMVGDMSVVCALARWPRIRSWEWARRFALPRKKWQRITNASSCCGTGC